MLNTYQEESIILTAMTEQRPILQIASGEHKNHFASCFIILLIIGGTCLFLNAWNNNWTLKAPILGNCDCDSDYHARDGSVIAGITLIVLAFIALYCACTGG